MMNFLSQFGISGFWTAKKSTIFGLLLIVAGLVLDYASKSTNHTAALIAGLASGPFLAWKGKLIADGSVTMPTLMALVIGGSLFFAAPARAQDATPGGLLPQAGTCFHNGDACIQPAVTVIPYVIDFKSLNVAQNIGFGFGYGLVFPKSFGGGVNLGVDFLAGTQTGGGWLAAPLFRVMFLRIGPVISHKPGVTYGGLGIGVGQ